MEAEAPERLERTGAKRAGGKPERRPPEISGLDSALVCPAQVIDIDDPGALAAGRRHLVIRLRTLVVHHNPASGRRICAMKRDGLVIVALSGGVDSAVSAMLLRDAGHDVQCLHMSNWEDDGYCEAARDFQDARRVCRHLDLPLHRVNFSAQYKERVFADFLEELRRGRTPNPDVLCNREIKFGTLWRYARRLGGAWLATGHYARLKRSENGRVDLHKGKDPGKEQSYFLHALEERDFRQALFPLGEIFKSDVRKLARDAGLPVAEKKDSTGICFVGERPFSRFIGEYLPTDPGAIKDPDGRTLGEHQGLAFYTVGQRRGLGIGGQADCLEGAWYVARKDLESNELIVVQGTEHPALYQDQLTSGPMHWINEPPREWSADMPFTCNAKTRYRQPDQTCTVMRRRHGGVRLQFEQPQRAVTPGQYVVLYQGSRCLGGATIETAEMRPEAH